MSLCLSGEELMAWNDLSARKWRDFVTEHPAVLSVASDIRDSATIGQVLQHVVVVELRYAQRLASQPESDYSSVKYGSGDELLATHDQALGLMRPLLADTGFDWEREIEFITISAGKIRARRKTVFVHAMMHSVRHYAQLATLARQHGFKPGWPMDYLFMDRVR